jgi:hypothetical protein
MGAVVHVGLHAMPGASQETDFLQLHFKLDNRQRNERVLAGGMLNFRPLKFNLM